MIRRWMMVLLVVALTGSAALAQQPAEQPVVADQAASNPDEVVAKIGQTEITQGQLDSLLEQIPAFQRSSYRDRALTYLAGNALNAEFVRVKNLTVDEAQYEQAESSKRAEFEQAIARAREGFERELTRLRPTMAFDAYLERAQSDEQVNKLIADHPEFFDGTKLTVSHILVKCSLYDSTVDQKAARDKLQQVVDRINARELTFADAASQFSDCPSKDKGGDLGQIEFGGPMDPYFTLQAYSTAEGHISKVFRTSFGWHVVLVTEVERGDGTPKPWTSQRGQGRTPQDLARQALRAVVDNQIQMAVMDLIPVENNLPKIAPTPPAPPAAPATAPAAAPAAE
ncbi:MAG: hypothetical protein GX591_06945 [Planctomycetes bacterium]|nr:hypothetical protein [Planctomycetota bacterium]